MEFEQVLSSLIRLYLRRFIYQRKTVQMSIFSIGNFVNVLYDFQVL